jgi:hypothetical protein
MKYAMLFAVLAIPVLSHAQFQDTHYNELRSHFAEGYNSFATGDYRVLWNNGKPEVRRLDRMVPNPKGWDDSVIQLDNYRDTQRELSSDDFRSGVPVSADGSSDYLVRQVAATGRRDRVKLVVERVQKSLTYTRGQGFPQLVGYEVAGESGSEIVQRGDLIDSRDRYVSAQEMLRLIREAKPEVKVEVPWPTLYKLLDEGVISKKVPASRAVLMDMVSALEKRPNGDFPKGSRDAILGLTQDRDKEIAKMLEPAKAKAEGNVSRVAREVAHQVAGAAK